MRTLWFVMTRTCNLDCDYCYQGSHKWDWQKEAGLIKHITDEVMEKTLKWSLEWGDDGIRGVFYGGEPLLQFDLIKKWVPIYEKAFENAGKKVKFSVTTNGTMLKPEVREFMDEHKLDMLMSMDGPPWIHDKQRFFYGGKPSWDSIPVDDILAWRPNVEIAWQLDPKRIPVESDLQWMIDRGFKRINFNINWLDEWDSDARLALTLFMRGVGRRTIRERNTVGGFRNNLFSKFNEIFLKDDRSPQPCGTGLNMLAVSPEGWLYPSQEMVFTVVEPGRAKDTEAYYRVGNVHESPVISQERLAEVSTIKNDDMVTPEGFDCHDCAARNISFGGCHCRYVGSDGVDPSNRYDVLPGWCQSEQAWVTGFLQAATIEKYLTFKTVAAKKQSPAQADNAAIRRLENLVLDLRHKMETLDILRVEKV